MGLRIPALRKAVSGAFKAIGELNTAITYRRTASVYNPATGQMVKTNTDYTITGVLTSFSQTEVDRVVVMATDQKVIVESVKMPVIPVAATDTILYGGKVYSLIRVINDPSNSVTTLHVRAP